MLRFTRDTKLTEVLSASFGYSNYDVLSGTMMATVIDRIEALVARVPHKTETQLAQMLFGGRGSQQRVNAACRRLVRDKRIVRQGKGGLTDPFTYRIAAKDEDLGGGSD